MELFARKCHCCGKGMNEGHIWDDIHTFCGTDCLLEWLYMEEICYHTEWYVESDTDGEVYDEKGTAWELKKCPEETESIKEKIHRRAQELEEK